MPRRSSSVPPRLVPACHLLSPAQTFSLSHFLTFSPLPPRSATLFFTVARTKELFGASPENLLGYALAGSVAWGVASLAEGPIDLYKSQMQKQLIEQRQNPGLKATYASMGDAVRKSVAWNGLRGPFQGLSAVCLRNFPAAGMYFGTYETLKLKLPALTGDASPTLAHLFVAGGTAGLAYWAFFYPLDVIKSAMQTDSMDPAKRRYRSVAATAASLWAEGGVGRFYKGVAPCLIRAVPANAISATGGGGFCFVVCSAESAAADAGCVRARHNSPPPPPPHCSAYGQHEGARAAGVSPGVGAARRGRFG